MKNLLTPEEEIKLLMELEGLKQLSDRLTKEGVSEWKMARLRDYSESFGRQLEALRVRYKERNRQQRECEFDHSQNSKILTSTTLRGNG